MVTSYSFSTLPAELLSRVAELVHEQDVAFAKLLEVDPIKRADSPPTQRDLELDIVSGLWSYWYGRGIKALARVDRATRAAALPHLYQNITAKQTHTSWFRYEVLGEDLAQHVRHLEITDNDLVLPKLAESVACALRRLPNLSSLVLGYCALAKLDDPQPGVKASQRDAMLRGALRVALGKVTSLQLDHPDVERFLAALRYASGSRLRRLCLTGPRWKTSRRAEVRAVCRGLVGLVELEINHLSDDTSAAMRRDLRLPSVRSVVLATGLSYEDDLALAHFIAPSITYLAIYNPICADEISAPESEVPSPSPLLPTLRTIALDCDFYRDDLHEITLPSLEHYDLSVRYDSSSFPLDLDEMPFDSPHLRTITVSLRPLYLDEPHRAFEDTCAAAGVRLVVHTRPFDSDVIADTKSFVIDWSSDPPISPSTSHGAVLKQLFDWAGRRAQWLSDVGDAAGLRELADAAVRLQERRIIEGS
ncbi:hypothetical protein JCM3775_001150 [Rhodotorula graminis]|uniref:Uncharacterized protein n=1 Tax=Rhodotorula graminis (strain WP1) TaxID=578459 RepID=A0A0P9GWL4_RHOGW|nr:uncharacterized protein RHOBADRAFT_56429 [Rhodotorula graminis WP1]KPV71816.1 hypothetical protein RHOBADRAFT_56429 [Rhodotorula graminis WP1]